VDGGSTRSAPPRDLRFLQMSFRKCWACHAREVIMRRRLVTSWHPSMARYVTFVAAGILGAACLIAQTSNDFRQDFATAIEGIAASYAYFDTKVTRQRVDRHVAPAGMGGVVRR
jgi:hypothetical protein